MTIQEIAELWQGHLQIPNSTIIRELRLGWYKWSKEKQGAEGFRCGVPLTAMPSESELPDVGECVDREFLEQFSIKQGWKMPETWRAAPKGSDRYPGRPSIRRAIEKRLTDLAAKGELEGGIGKQASVLREWADKEYHVEQVPTEKIIENQIRELFRVLKRESS